MRRIFQTREVKKDRIVVIPALTAAWARSSSSSFFANGDPDRSLAANVAVGSYATEPFGSAGN